jgi:hypothetical protein
LQRWVTGGSDEQPPRTRASGGRGGGDREASKRGIIGESELRDCLTCCGGRKQDEREGGFLGEHRRSMLMSVVCAVQFNNPERTVTRMTVFDYNANSLDIGRALALACAAYESRMKRPPPLIKEPERIAGYPDILQYQYRATDGGKIFTISAAEYRRDLLFASIFTGLPAGNGAQQEPRRPRIRSIAEWREFQRRKDLRRLTRADPDLRRELLNTMDTCPCCDQRLGHHRPPVDNLMNGGSDEQSARKRVVDPVRRDAPAPAKPDAAKAARKAGEGSDAGGA